jgi:hypothetical protein
VIFSPDQKQSPAVYTVNQATIPSIEPNNMALAGARAKAVQLPIVPYFTPWTSSGEKLCKIAERVTKIQTRPRTGATAAPTYSETSPLSYTAPWSESHETLTKAAGRALENGKVDKATALPIHAPWTATGAELTDMAREACTIQSAANDAISTVARSSMEARAVALAAHVSPNELFMPWSGGHEDVKRKAKAAADQRSVSCADDFGPWCDTPNTILQKAQKALEQDKTSDSNRTSPSAAAFDKEMFDGACDFGPWTDSPEEILKKAEKAIEEGKDEKTKEAKYFDIWTRSVNDVISEADKQIALGFEMMGAPADVMVAMQEYAFHKLMNEARCA